MEDQPKYKSWLEFLKDGLYKEESSFLRFAVLWLSFNAYLNEEYGKKIWGDKNKVIKFVSNEKNKHFYQQLLVHKDFKDVVSVFYSTKESGRLFVIDMKTRKDEHNKDFTNEKQSLENFLMTIYQIRCNFFHGDKIPYNADDQKLVEWAYQYFYVFWEQYLDRILPDSQAVKINLQKKKLKP